MPAMTSPVLAGAEPFAVDGGPTGALVLHGFTGSPASMRPVYEALADGGFTVEVPLLPGHGTAVEDMMDTRWEDWSAAAEKALQQLSARCTTVVVVGLSMGGTLATWLAQHNPDIEGLVLVNPLIEAPDAAFRSAVQELLDSGSPTAPGIGSDIALEGVDEISYSDTPLAAALSLFEGAAQVAGALERVRCPVLLLSSRQDHVVSPSSGDLLAGSVSGPCERVWLERSYHVATLDHDQDEVVSRTVDFVARIGTTVP